MVKPCKQKNDGILIIIASRNQMDKSAMLCLLFKFVTTQHFHL